MVLPRQRQGREEEYGYGVELMGIRSTGSDIGDRLRIVALYTITPVCPIK